MRGWIFFLWAILFLPKLAFCEESSPSLGIFDSFYDPNEWVIHQSTGKVDIFVNKNISNCRIYYDRITEPYEDSIEKSTATFSSNHYYVTKGLYDGKIQSIYYCDDNTDCLRVIVKTVKNKKACIAAAEKILADHAKNEP
jgi:hypothetical protein